MKNYDYWKSFVSSGKIDDYLHYIACTKEEGDEESCSATDTGNEKEGGYFAGFNYRDRNGSVGPARWRV